RPGTPRAPSRAHQGWSGGTAAGTVPRCGWSPVVPTRRRLGKAAIEAEAAAEVEEILRDVVVVRGDGPRPPRELLPLHLPGKPGEQSAPARPTLDLDSGRGPEITEVG